MYNFSPAFPGSVLFGSTRPGFPSERVSDKDIKSWIDFMVGAGIKRVICLLTDTDIAKFYGCNLIVKYYRDVFDVVHFPIEDFSRIPDKTLNTILTFIGLNRTLVHCSAGMGRTGQVIYAYLRRMGYTPTQATTLCLQGGRHPLEYTFR